MKIKKWLKNTLSALAVGGLLTTFPLPSLAAENHQHGDTTPAVTAAPQENTGNHSGVGSMTGGMISEMMNGMMQGTVVKAVYELTGIDKKEIINQHHAGKSFMEIAKSKGVTEEKLLETIISAHTAKIDQKVQDGKMDEEMAKQCKEHFEAKIKEMLNKTEVKTKSQNKEANKHFGSIIKKALQQVQAHKDKHLG